MAARNVTQAVECEDDVCITCGDVAVELRVVEVDGAEARCVTDDGATERIAVDLVLPLAPGERVLAHAGVAIAKLAADGGGR